MHQRFSVDKCIPEVARLNMYSWQIKTLPLLISIIVHSKLGQYMFCVSNVYVELLMRFSVTCRLILDHFRVPLCLCFSFMT